MAYTHYLNGATHYLFLGTNGGRMLQVELSSYFMLDCCYVLCMITFLNRYDCATQSNISM